MKILNFLPILALAPLPLSAVQVQLLLAVFESETALNGFSSTPLISPPILDRGATLSASDDFPGWYDSGNWSTSPSFPGIASGSYLSVSFSVDPGYVWTPSSFSIAYQDAGSLESARRLQLRYSGDGFSSVLFQDTFVNSFPDAIDVNTVDLSALSALSGPVEFRLYGFGALSASGILGLTNDNSLMVSGNPYAVVIEGDLAVVPEPASVALFLGLSASALILLRRRRS